MKKKYNLPSLNHGEIQHLKRIITSKDIESGIKTLQEGKAKGLEHMFN